MLEGLQRARLLENTYVIYTSDHGEMGGEHGMWSKRSYYDASAGAPLIGLDWSVGAIAAAAAMAGDLFAEALEHAGQSGLSAERHDGGVLALAIDPLFAPALLTVGSLEYQCGRVAAAMGLFLALTSLPPTEPDLVEIIDKAGSFLLDRKDHRNALRLYRAATGTGPGTAVYWSGLGYCLGRLGRKEDAVTAARKAVEIERRNHIHLTDLGWALVEAGHYEEARAVLQAAVALAPPGYALARNNLKELEERAHRHGAARRVVPVNSEQAQAALFAKQSPRDVRKK